MASPLRVKNTAYFDIAATASTNGHLGFLHGPLVGGYAPTTRPTSQPSPVLAAKIRFGAYQRLRDTNQGHPAGLRPARTVGHGEPANGVAAGKADGRAFQAANVRSPQADTTPIPRGG
jgi:hypothetical protein